MPRISVPLPQPCLAAPMVANRQCGCPVASTAMSTGTVLLPPAAPLVSLPPPCARVLVQRQQNSAPPRPAPPASTSPGAAGGSTVPSSPHDNQEKIVAARFRTKLCSKWQLTGQCPYESRCMFAHGHHALRTAELNLKHGLTSEDAIRTFKRYIELRSSGVAVQPPKFLQPFSFEELTGAVKPIHLPVADTTGTTVNATAISPVPTYPNLFTVPCVKNAHTPTSPNNTTVMQRNRFGSYSSTTSTTASTPSSCCPSSIRHYRRNPYSVDENSIILWEAEAEEATNSTSSAVDDGSFFPLSEAEIRSESSSSSSSWPYRHTPEV